MCGSLDVESTEISRISSVAAMANTPSLNASSREVPSTT
jgi:hypothetical protein